MVCLFTSLKKKNTCFFFNLVRVRKLCFGIISCENIWRRNMGKSKVSYLTKQKLKTVKLCLNTS